MGGGVHQPLVVGRGVYQLAPKRGRGSGSLRSDNPSRSVRPVSGPEDPAGYAPGASEPNNGHSSMDKRAYPEDSAILLHLLAISAERDYNANDAEACR